MSTIGGRPIAFESIADFLSVYTSAPKPIFFWDTCGLLEIIRFIFRKNNGQNSLNAIMDLAGKVSRDEIYCVTSELAAIEWDDNESKAISVMKKGLVDAEAQHLLAAATIQAIIPGTVVNSNPISIYRLEDLLKDMALDIAQSSHFIKYDEIAKDTLTRVALKLHPTKEKTAEIKDCAFWETMIRICKEIKAAMPGGSPAKVFYSVNTDDFADKSRGTTVLYQQLQDEAAQMGFTGALLIDNAVAAL